MKPVSGVIVPAVTALTSRRDFDSESQGRLLTSLSDAGVDAVLALGLTGECYALPGRVKREVVKFSARKVKELREKGSKLELLVGITGFTPSETVKNIDYAHTLYHAGLPIKGLVMQPSRIGGIEDERGIILEGFLQQINSMTELPIYLYANPDTAINKEVVTPGLVRGIAPLNRFYGAKVSMPFPKFKQYCSAANNEWGIYIGNALDMFKAFSKKGSLKTAPKGVVTGPGNVFPNAWKRAWDLCQDYDPDKVKSLKAEFRSFNKLCEGTPSRRDAIAVFKYALHLNGILSSPTCTQKTKPLTVRDERYLRSKFQALGISK